MIATPRRNCRSISELHTTTASAGVMSKQSPRSGATTQTNSPRLFYAIVVPYVVDCGASGLHRLFWIVGYLAAFSRSASRLTAFARGSTSPLCRFQCGGRARPPLKPSLRVNSMAGVSSGGVASVASPRFHGIRFSANSMPSPQTHDIGRLAGLDRAQLTRLVF